MVEKKTELAKSSLVEEVALAKINQYVEIGMVLPEGFNPANSLKKARMMLNDMKVQGKPVLEVCTKESIIQCLIESCCQGLDYSTSQLYFIPRGNVMTNLESVYGRIARAKRASRYYKPIVQYVHEGDTFEIGVDPINGKTIIKKHETSLENLDKPIIAAYTYVTDDNNDTNIFIMTKKEWLKSWTKSPNGAAVAKEFERDMIYRTIIKKSTKSLVNSDIRPFIPFNEHDDDEILAGDEAPHVTTTQSFTEFDEAEDVTEVLDGVDPKTGEIKPNAAQKQPTSPQKTVPKNQSNDDLEF